MKRSLPSPTDSREAIRSSAEFRAFVEQQSLEAQRRRDDAQAKIEAKRTDKQRARADHENTMTEFDREIGELLDTVDDEQEIIAAAERALSMQRPAPTLAPHTEVQDELEHEKP